MGAPPLCVRTFFSEIMTIEEVRERVRRMKDGFQQQVLDCMADNSHDMVLSVREQLYSGLDGNGTSLSPSYDSDPYFTDPHAGYFDEERGHWVNCYLHPERYIAWKQRITPPESGQRLNLPPRPSTVPNLFIVGTFHMSISSRPTSRGVEIFTSGWDSGPLVERKYGSQIFKLTDNAVQHFNESFLWPWLKSWMQSL